MIILKMESRQPNINVIDFECKHGPAQANLNRQQVICGQDKYCADVYDLKPSQLQDPQLANLGKLLKPIVAINHPNIVRVLGFRIADSKLYILKEFIKEDLITKPDKEMMTAAWASASADLDYMHNNLHETYDDWDNGCILFYKDKKDGTLIVKLADVLSRKMVKRVLKQSGAEDLGSFQQRKTRDWEKLRNILFSLEDPEYTGATNEKKHQIEEKVCKQDSIKKEVLNLHKNPQQLGKKISSVIAIVDPNAEFDGAVFPDLQNTLDMIEHKKPVFRAKNFPSQVYKISEKISGLQFTKVEEISLDNVYMSQEAFNKFIGRSEQQGCQLKRLKLVKCGIIPQYFKDLKKGRFVEKLVELDLSSNAIGYGLAIVIDAFPHLNILKLSGCRFSRDDAAKFLEKKNNLEILIMNNTQFGSDPLQPLGQSFKLANMPNLRFLNLSGANLNDNEFFGLMTCSGLPKLEYIDLSNNMVRTGLKLVLESFVGTDYAKIFKNLKAINLQNNLIALGEGLNIVWKYEHLSKVYIFGNPLASSSKYYLMSLNARLISEKLTEDLGSKVTESMNKPKQQSKSPNKNTHLAPIKDKQPLPPIAGVGA